MLLTGHKLTATEAHERGLVTRVFPQQHFDERIKEIVHYMASLPPMVRFKGALSVDLLSLCM